MAKKICIFKVLISTIIVLSLLISSIQFTYAETNEHGVATDLKITLVLSEKPDHNNFTRDIRFVNKDGNILYVPVSFETHNGLEYYGNVTDDGLKTLETMAANNYRTYWDKMYFENRNGSTLLKIADLKIWIIYGNHKNNSNGDWESEIMIAHAQNKTLAKNEKFLLSNNAGRRDYICDYFGLTSTQFYNLPSALRFMVYDLGKSGSSDKNDSYDSDNNVKNPKYGLTGDNLCSEVISWYYYKYNVRITAQWGSNKGKTYDFKDITSNSVMLDQFHYANRRYDYHIGRGQWIRKDKDSKWVYSDVITPKPGDYICRDRDHAMMLISWDSKNKMAYVLDGPSPIAIRKVPIEKLENKEKDMMLGRIPAND